MSGELRPSADVPYGPRASTKEEGERRRSFVDPKEARLLAPHGCSHAVIQGGGFVAATVRTVSEPRLDLAVELKVPQIYVVSSRELDGNPQDPATYARFEICRDIFNAVAKEVSIERAETTLAEVGDCVQKMHWAVVAESLECSSADEVFTAVSREARQRIASDLLGALRATCGAKW